MPKNLSKDLSRPVLVRSENKRSQRIYAAYKPNHAHGRCKRFQIPSMVAETIAGMAKKPWRQKN